jgi:hypothetical protein
MAGVTHERYYFRRRFWLLNHPGHGRRLRYGGGDAPDRLSKRCVWHWQLRLCCATRAVFTPC